MSDNSDNDEAAADNDDQSVDASVIDGLVVFDSDNDDEIVGGPVDFDASLAYQLLQFRWLPDNLSLVFWMLTEAPHTFFYTPQPLGKRGKKRKQNLQADSH